MEFSTCIGSWVEFDIVRGSSCCFGSCMSHRWGDVRICGGIWLALGVFRAVCGGMHMCMCPQVHLCMCLHACKCVLRSCVQGCRCIEGMAHGTGRERLVPLLGGWLQLVGHGEALTWSEGSPSSFARGPVRATCVVLGSIVCLWVCLLA